MRKSEQKAKIEASKQEHGEQVSGKVRKEKKIKKKEQPSSDGFFLIKRTLKRMKTVQSPPMQLD